MSAEKSMIEKSLTSSAKRRSRHRQSGHDDMLDAILQRLNGIERAVFKLGSPVSSVVSESEPEVEVPSIVYDRGELLSARRPLDQILEPSSICARRLPLRDVAAIALF